MPVHDVGYRSWHGTPTHFLSRWRIIAETGIRLAVKSRWVRRLLFAAWLPVLYWGIAFFALEQGLNDGPGLMSRIDNRGPVERQVRNALEEAGMSPQQESRKAVAGLLRESLPMLPKVDMLAESLESGDDATARNTVWCWLLMTFFRYPQGLLILMLLGFIAPGLISQDVRSRAFLLYFSRPIGRIEYLFGKLMIPAVYIMLVTTLPAMALYLFAVMLSPNLSVVFSTWDIPFRILAASAVLVVPTASLALMLSSLTHESRFASFAWFAIWALGHGAWFAVLIAQTARMQRPPFEPEVIDSPLVQNWSVLSLYNNLGGVQSWIFGFADLGDVWPGMVALAAITVFSLVLMYRRISAPIRV